MEELGRGGGGRGVRDEGGDAGACGVEKIELVEEVMVKAMKGSRMCLPLSRYCENFSMMDHWRW